jgi:zinc protease
MTMRIKPTFFLLLVAGLASCAASHQTSSGRMLAQSANIVSDVQEFDLAGVHVIMRQSTAAPVVSAILFIKGGSSMTPPDEPISTEYFAMNVAAASGSQRIGKAYFRRKMVAMGTTINGEDGRDYSAISMHCTRENFDTSWSYFTDMMRQPAFDPNEFENFRQAVLINLNSISSDAESYSDHIADSIYFAGHPYGRMISSSDIQRVTLDLVKRHYQSIMVKSRFLLVVVGNISRDELAQKIKASMADIPEGSYTPVAMTPPAKAFSPGAYFPPFDRKLPTDYILGYFLAPSRGDSDYYPYLRLRNFFGGFVFNHIRVEHNLAYAPNVDEREGETSVGVISLQTPYVDSAVRIIYDDVDFFQQNRIRESAIREGVAGWATRNYMKAETTSSQAVYLGQAKLLTGDWHNAFFSYDKLAQVTPDQIVNAANKYLRNFNWFIIGDTTHVNRPLLESR